MVLQIDKQFVSYFDYQGCLPLAFSEPLDGVLQNMVLISNQNPS
jgi:hypothetical protein